MGLSVLMLIFVISCPQPGVYAGHGNSARLVAAQASENFERDASTPNENSAAVIGKRYTFEGDEFETSRIIDQDEREYRVFYGGVIGIEIAFNETGIIFQQVTDGEKIVQLVYAGSGLLAECEVEEDTEAFNEFLAKFLHMNANMVRRMMYEDKPIDVTSLIGKTRASEGNVYYELLENRPPREPLDLLVDIHNLEQQCIDLHLSSKQYPTSRGTDYEVNQDTDNMKEITHKNRRAIMSDNSSPAVRQIRESSQLAESQRMKRSLFGFIKDMKDKVVGHLLPGTEGCRREHDRCPTTIKSRSTKYRYDNPYVYTISHCGCDNTFRTCLKKVGSIASVTAGRLFFDLVGTRCFVLERRKVCEVKGFWGKCKPYFAAFAVIQPHIGWN